MNTEIYEKLTICEFKIGGETDNNFFTNTNKLVKRIDHSDPLLNEFILESSIKVNASDNLIP